MAIFTPYGSRRRGKSGAVAAAIPEAWLILNFNNGEGQSAITNEGTGEFTWPAIVGAIQDDAQKMFSSASSELLPGGEFSIVTSQTGVTGFDTNGNWTFEFFFRSASVDSAETFVRLDGAALGAIRIMPTDSAGVIFQVSDADGNNIADISGTPTLLNDTWYHFAGVKSSTTYSLYFGAVGGAGTRLATVTAAGTPDPANQIVFTDGENVSGVWLDSFWITQAAKYSGASYTIPTVELT